MAAWTVMVRDVRGLALATAVLEAEKVSDIDVERDGRDVTLTLKGDSLSRGRLSDDLPEDSKVELVRWPLTEPMSKPVVKAY